MSAVYSLPPVQNGAAKRRYLEIYGSSWVLNSYLLLALFCVSAVCLALLVQNIRLSQKVLAVKPIVVRINEAGRAEAIRYDAMTYQPQESEMKYFLSRFVVDHYGRVRATVRENYPRSLYFLEERQATATVEADRKNKALEAFIAGQGDEIDIEVKSVTLEDLRKPPYRATVEFEKVYLAEGDHRETKREKYIASFVLLFKDHIPNNLILMNPLGMTITYFREDQVFQGEGKR